MPYFRMTPGLCTQKTIPFVLVVYVYGKMGPYYTRMQSSRMHTAHSLPYGGSLETPPTWTETPHLDRDPTRPPDRDPLWTDRHLWKHNLRKLRLRAVNITPAMLFISITLIFQWELLGIAAYIFVKLDQFIRNDRVLSIIPIRIHVKQKPLLIPSAAIDRERSNYFHEQKLLVVQPTFVSLKRWSACPSAGEIPKTAHFKQKRELFRKYSYILDASCPPVFHTS